MKYADVDPDLNRRLIAERYGWPDDALAQCILLEGAARARELERQEQNPEWRAPAWLVYWGRGPFGQPPQLGYRAVTWVQDQHGHRKVELFAEDPAGLPDRMADVERALPDWPAHLTPLVPPR